MKHNAKFFLERRTNKATGQVISENVPIFCSITFSGERLFYFTGFRIDATGFNLDDQKATSKGMEGKRPVQANIINNRLKAIKARLELHFQGTTSTTKDEVIKLLNDACKKTDKDETPETITDYTFFAMFEGYLSNCNLSEGRKKHIRTTINHWRKFEAYKGVTIAFEGVNIEMLNDFERYLIKDSTKPKARNNKEEVSSPKGLNTVVNILKITRTFWRYARNVLKDKGIQLHYPFEDYKIKPEEYGEPIYINIDERNILFSAFLHSERLQRVRDMFVFQCLVGARVGDLCKLTKDNLYNNVLTYIPRKTKDGKPVPVRIPLHPMAIEILSRYDMPDGSLLPYITDQRYNEYLKELFEAVGLTRNVTRLNSKTRMPEVVRLCDIASSHMARRAFVGNLYGKVDNGIIGSMSGHIAGSKAFARYYKVSEDLQIDAINKL